MLRRPRSGRSRCVGWVRCNSGHSLLAVHGEVVEDILGRWDLWCTLRDFGQSNECLLVAVCVRFSTPVSSGSVRF